VQVTEACHIRKKGDKMPTNIDGLIVFGAIEEKWLGTAGPAGALGHPTNNEAPTFDGVGRFQNFQRGIVCWHPESGAHIIWGLIGARWLAIGREQFGYPITDEADFPGGGKCSTLKSMQVAGRPESSIVWQPGAAAAWELYGAIRNFWINVGSVLGPLHYPVDQERAAFDNRGRFQTFEGGTVSWHPDIPESPCVVSGLIGKRWLEIGREQFGYPVSGEMTFPDGGKYSTFRSVAAAGQPEATIVWKPGNPSAWEVYGAIRDKWISSGSISGPLGYPTGAEQPTFDGVGRCQQFEAGTVSWHPETGAHIVKGLICRRWAELGREQFGYPITDESTAVSGNGRFTHFRSPPGQTGFIHILESRGPGP
jgi:uncharacterized protein with LGFP repeats